MKKSFPILFVILLLGITFSSCRKGENDPLFSLLSRKSRLSGEWQLYSGSITTEQNGNFISTSYNGTTATTSSSRYPYSEVISIDRDGSFEWLTNDNGNTHDMKGYWSFGKRSKGMELKNKESVLFRITSETTIISGITYTDLYTGDKCPVLVINIDELRNKKMVMIVNGTDAQSSNTSSVNGTMTFKQK